MSELYMGIDVGSVFVKGIIIDEYDNIITSYLIETLGNPINAVKKVILKLKENIDLEQYKVVSVGVTGSARKLIGSMLNGQVIKNEITALSVGTMKVYPDVKTIIDIGGEDSKIIIVNDGVVVDYAINTSCNAGCGSFMDSLARRMNIDYSRVSDLALRSKNSIDVISSCMIFAESDLIHKIQEGYKIEDILAGACNAVCNNFINSVKKGKKVMTPIVFNGGVSKNIYIVKYLEKLLGEDIIVNKNAQYMCAFGIAIMAKKSNVKKEFSFNIDNYNIDTRIANCLNCSSNCEIVTVYKNNNLIDMWGNKCDKIKNNCKES